MLECVINISEGRRLDLVERIARSAGSELLDVHADPDHHRSVITLVGSSSARAVAAASILSLDIRDHAGAHPRIGVLDVVPFVPLFDTPMLEAIAARDDMAAWLASSFGLPCFLYGPERSLPEIRRRAFVELAPDVGPPTPHLTAGACAVGARPMMVAYNVWLAGADLARAQAIAREVRSPHVRSLGLAVGQEVQVSMNLISPAEVGPAEVFDRIGARADIARGELVGLIPEAGLHAIPTERWLDLDLSANRTIEARLRAQGLLVT